MNLAPLLELGPIVTSHVAFAAIATLVGGLQFALPKGTKAHKMAGYIWVLMMALVAVGSFFISQLKTWGYFSPIHILSVVVLVSLFMAIRAAMSGNIKRHKSIMVSLYATALLLTGGFTLLPGRAMHAVFFGE